MDPMKSILIEKIYILKKVLCRAFKVLTKDLLKVVIFQSRFYVVHCSFCWRRSLCLSGCSWSCPRLVGAEMDKRRKAWEQTVHWASSQSGQKKKYTDWNEVPHNERDMLLLYFKTKPLLRLQGTSAPGAATVHVVNIGLFSKQTKCFHSSRPKTSIYMNK